MKRVLLSIAVSLLTAVCVLGIYHSILVKKTGKMSPAAEVSGVRNMRPAAVSGVRNMRPAAEHPGDLQNAFADAIDRAMPAVVLVTAQKRVGVVSFDFWGDPENVRYRDVPSGQGSGFFIREDGLVLTNYHVIREQDSFWITMNDGTELSAKVIGADPPSDLALLKVDGGKRGRFPFLAFAEPSELRVGHWAIAIGAPFSLSRTVTVGIVSHTQRSGVGMNLYENYIQTDASVNPGNSGGPLLNLRGEVIGVNDFILSPTGGNIGLTFAISSGIAKEISEKLIRDGHVIRPWLGIAFRDFTREELKEYGPGVPVLRTFRNSPASGVLQNGDILVGAGGETVRNSGDLMRLVFGRAPDDSISLRVIRRGRTLTLNLSLTPAPKNYYRQNGDRSVRML